MLVLPTLDYTKQNNSHLKLRGSFESRQKVLKIDELITFGPAYSPLNNQTSALLPGVALVLAIRLENWFFGREVISDQCRP